MQHTRESAVAMLSENSDVISIGAPVDVGMSIDIASIDMVSEVNMVSYNSYLLTSCYAVK